MQRVAGILCLGVFRASVEAADDLQACFGDPRQQRLARTQSEQFGDVGNDQPALAAVGQMGRQTAEEAAQHARIGVIDGIFDRRGRLRRQPRRIADDERRLAIRKQVGLDDLHMVGQPQALDVFRCAGQRPRILVGGDNLRHAAPREHGSDDAGAGADVEGQFAAGRKRRRGEQIDILAAHR